MNDQYRKGAENLPQRGMSYDTPQPILIIVYDLRNKDNVVEERRLDYAKLDDRKWLGKITHWAINNHHSVETIAIADAEAEFESKL